MSDPGAGEPPPLSFESIGMKTPEPIAFVTTPVHHFLSQVLGDGLVLSPRFSIEGLWLNPILDTKEDVIKLIISNGSESNGGRKESCAQCHPAGTKIRK